MKFIKNGIIYEPHSDFVAEQMKKGGFQVYEETKEEVKEVTEEVVEITEEKKSKKKKK